MKIRITVKDPDAIGDAIMEAAEKEVNAIEGLSQDEKEMLMETRQEKLSNLFNTFFEWGEYIRIEIDTEAKTARVIPV